MTTSPYSPGLNYYIDNPSFAILLPNVEAEIEGFLHARPVVVLTNGSKSVHYLRPGLQKDIQAAFVERNKVADIPAKPRLDRTVIDFSDEKNPPLCSKHPDDLQHLFDVCERVGLLKELFLEIVHHDTDYFQQQLETTPPRVGLSPLGLFECACVHHSSNRLFTKMRDRVEKQVIEHILALVPDKSQPVKILSLASGHLLQDWKLIGLLVNAGYSTMEWTVVDPINQSEAPLDKIKAFFSKIPTLQVSFTAYDKIVDVPDDCLNQIHAATVIDGPDGICSDIVSMIPKLAAGAKIFHTGGDNLFSIDSQGIKVVRQPSVYKQLAADAVKALPQNHTAPIRISVLYQWTASLHTIAALQEHGVRTIQLVTNVKEQALYAALFPACTFQISSTTPQEMEERIKNREYFDFILTKPLDKSAQQRIGLATFQKATQHIPDKTTTAYLISAENYSIFRWISSL